MNNHKRDSSASETGLTVRPMAVAGQFYPADKDELYDDVANYFKHTTPEQKSNEVQAVIVPHAGYVFSGEVAASAFAYITPNRHYDHVFLLGPTHHVTLDGASVCNAFDYDATPLGNIKVDRELCNQLIDKNACFTYRESAHTSEHCLEVQLPLLQYLFKEVPPIIPIIIGTERLQTLHEIANALKPYFNSNNLFVISSDFSHYPSYDDALNVDKRTGDAVMSCRIDKFVQAIAENDSLGISNLATSACGQCAIAILLMMAEDDSSLHISHKMYRNSGDSPYGGKREVVGYHAFTMTRDTDFRLTEKDKQELLGIARKSIDARMNNEEYSPQLSNDSILCTKCGAFVTLTESGHLRGCIGRFDDSSPLCDVVTDMAQAAAFEDPRFYPVVADELKDIDIEISVLTPLRRIHNIDEFEYGRQGIYIKKGNRSGTFLPQVANEVNWTKEEFLSHCAQDKAGIGWDGWRDAELFTYEAIIIK
jgi:AmmeMemoRadiSam system protein B/AmmeMemoRadiSam system protein A